MGNIASEVGKGEVGKGEVRQGEVGKGEVGKGEGGRVRWGSVKDDSRSMASVVCWFALSMAPWISP